MMMWLLLIGLGCFLASYLLKKNDDVGAGELSAHQRRKIVLNILTFGLAVVAGFAIYLNINPYVDFVRVITASTNWGWFFETPIGAFITALIGMFIWVVFQIFELLPEILKKDMQTIRNLIHNMENHIVLPIFPSDLPVIRELKRHHNNTPTRWYRTANRIRTGVYAADLLLCMFQYPPLDGGADGVWLFLQAGSFSDINWINLLFVLITLFAVEAIYHAYQWIKQMKAYLGRAERSSQTVETSYRVDR
ncbi:hypothetical protein [Leptolyngbya sp. FACHB-16]|uniref:hypothetical protein n=1 Tax=unclassified Leptolyngbya TaxID=2650499 RepID=UPI001687791F|nr:hypothetical protein [Leptolyngbya sp. FACHB-16]MBD2153106.1 hypothetical protein [Leptolyngbya sp. FACHB-16]